MSAPVALVLAKAPVAHRVKTRLGARIGHEVAARLAAAALHDTLDICEAAYGADRCYLALDGDLVDAEDGRALANRLRSWTVLGQRGEGLAERLVHAHRDVARFADGPVVQIGMDTPHASTADLRAVADGLVDHDAVLGPALDGGWWVLGLARPGLADVLAGVEMSTECTWADTRSALEAVGALVATGPLLRDVDEVEDAAAVAALAPDTRFARRWADVRQEAAR